MSKINSYFHLTVGDLIEAKIAQSQAGTWGGMLQLDTSTIFCSVEQLRSIRDAADRAIREFRPEEGAAGKTAEAEAIVQEKTAAGHPNGRQA